MLRSVSSYAGAAGTLHDSLHSCSHWQSEFQMHCLPALWEQGDMRASVASSQQTTPKRLDILSPVDTGHHTPGLGHTQSASFQCSWESPLSSVRKSLLGFKLDICTIDLSTHLSLSPLG